MTAKEARATEYKGMVYRSKSEAMFARWLELRLDEDEYLHSHGNPFFAGSFGDSRGGFVYEPQLFKEWKPDFVVWQVLCEGGLPSMQLEIIEYKPSRPTNTYCDEFCNRAKLLVDEHVSQGLMVEQMSVADFRIYYGSVWNRDRGTIACHEVRGQWKVRVNDDDWLAMFEAEVKETRFDLRATSSV